MPTRVHIGQLPARLLRPALSALLGLMVALLFRSYYHWGAGHDKWFIGFCALFPLAGAIKTRQRDLTAGLLAGLALTIYLYIAWRPHP